MLMTSYSDLIGSSKEKEHLVYVEEEDYLFGMASDSDKTTIRSSIDMLNLLIFGYKTKIIEIQILEKCLIRIF